jgi:di/tripeptidase
MGRRKASEPQVLTVEEGIDSSLESVVENVVEEVAVEISSEEPIKEEPEDKGQLFAVYDNGEVIASVYENSEKLDELLEYNKKQLESRIAFLNETITDEAEIVRLNVRGSTSYSSWRQYLAQNGLTPSEPPIKTLFQYYSALYTNMGIEEIAIKVYGNLRYSFTPISML